jgi:hypothetical protein
MMDKYLKKRFFLKFPLILLIILIFSSCSIDQDHNAALETSTELNPLPEPNQEVPTQNLPEIDFDQSIYDNKNPRPRYMPGELVDYIAQLVTSPALAARF